MVKLHTQILSSTVSFKLDQCLRLRPHVQLKVKMEEFCPLFLALPHHSKAAARIGHSAIASRVHSLSASNVYELNNQAPEADGLKTKVLNKRHQFFKI